VRARVAVLVVSVTACLALAAPASAAVRTDVDHLNDARVTLDGRALTVTLTNPPRSPEVWGKRVRASCGTDVFQPRGSRYSIRSAVWPKGAKRFRTTLRRDLSERARVCFVEELDGGDVAVARFVRPETYRLLAKGRSHTGQPWRMAGRAGLVLEPCVKVLLGESHFQACLTLQLIRDVGMFAAAEQPDCTDDTFVYGMAPATTASVEVRLAGGSTVEAPVYGPPRGSRARARRLTVAIAGAANVERVIARDATGATVGRKRPQSAVCPG
jgi:hypothetical protein